MSQATLAPRPYLNSSLFSGHYLDNRLPDLDEWSCDDEARAAFDRLRERWLQEGDLVESYNEDDLLDKWIDEVLDALGFETLHETTLPDGGGHTDRLLFESRERRHEASVEKSDGRRGAAFSLASAVLEAKRWNADFTERFSEHRSYRDASHQIKYYLEKTPEAVEWGVLTDGRKWRLYGTKDYATETYYEVDLPELLSSGDLERFKYFYVFFRPAAFHETAGMTFLERVWNESETAAKELGEDLQNNVFTALRLLGEGFLESNAIDLDPDDAAGLDELKEQSLVLLYRLMFVLYAESRDLIHPEPAEAEEFRENFSLDRLRVDVHEDLDTSRGFDDYSTRSTAMWSRLQDLFRLVDSGDDELGIPPYNGGLFDDARHEFLAENVVTDRYVAEVVYRLGTTQADDGSFVLADYADLDTRHLGSIYEGLLEHEFRIAPEAYAAVAEDGGQVWKPATEVSVADAVETVEAGDLYVVNDDGERKATGAYYTPDYVVTYIVEETIDPLLADIETRVAERGFERGTEVYVYRFADAVLELKVLDPAMGSGHFLTKATGYLAGEVMERVREVEDVAGVLDEQDVRRTVAKECIYGVDVNGMAVELAKLSMWLETLAADSPLAFLDHHVKTGNSLVGSDVTEVLSDDAEENGGQLTLMQTFARIRERTLGHVMDLMQDLLAIDNEDLADIKSMEDLYDEIRSDPLYRRLFEMANVHTAERFGLDVPEGAYEQMAQAIEDDDEWEGIRGLDWFRSAQVTAREETFFHWELEFPEVFFGEDGGKLEDGGFDAVVGNPPWLNAWEMTEKYPDYREKLKRIFSSFDELKGHWDFYVPFVIKSLQLCKNHGWHSFILPSPVLTEKYATNLRETLLTDHSINSILSFGEQTVFDGVDRQCIIYVIQRSVPNQGEDDPREILRKAESVSPLIYERVGEVNHRTWLRRYNNQIRVTEDFLQSLPIIERIEEEEHQVGNFFYVNYGAQVSSKVKGEFSKSDVVTHDNTDGKRFFEGNDVQRYECVWSGKYLDYQPDKMYGPRDPELFESNKLAVSVRTAENERLKAGYDDAGMYCDHTVILCTPYSNIESSSLQVEFDGFERMNEDPDLFFALAQINSTLLTWFFRNKFATGALQGSYSDVWPASVRRLPIHKPTNGEKFEQSSFIVEVLEVMQGRVSEDDSVETVLSELSKELIEIKSSRRALNLSLLDHLGSYRDGPTLAEIGLAQPPEGSGESVLQETTEQKPNLKVGRTEINRESTTAVEIRLTARYKPDDETEHETDPYGYTETDPLPALRITDLTETEADLIEAFVPYAVEEAGGFADFRKNATKTNSPVDRLRALTLPRVEDVRDGLASYRETVARAEELDAKIERTDRLIDEIVYELYGLTDEEIDIVEAAVGD